MDAQADSAKGLRTDREPRWAPPPCRTFARGVEHLTTSTAIYRAMDMPFWLLTAEEMRRQE